MGNFPVLESSEVRLGTKFKECWLAFGHNSLRICNIRDNLWNMTAHLDQIVANRVQSVERLSVTSGPTRQMESTSCI